LIQDFEPKCGQKSLHLTYFSRSLGHIVSRAGAGLPVRILHDHN
jgi:hypothetical protein